jgi:hypothetical protein
MFFCQFNTVVINAAKVLGKTDDVAVYEALLAKDQRSFHERICNAMAAWYPAHKRRLCTGFEF